MTKIVGSKEDMAAHCWKVATEGHQTLPAQLVQRAMGLAYLRGHSPDSGDEEVLLALLVEHAWKEGFIACMSGFEAGAFGKVSNN